MKPDEESLGTIALFLDWHEQVIEKVIATWRQSNFSVRRFHDWSEYEVKFNSAAIVVTTPELLQSCPQDVSVRLGRIMLIVDPKSESQIETTVSCFKGLKFQFLTSTANRPTLSSALLVPQPGSTELTRPLTKREIQVLRGIASGMSNKQIGVELGLSELTVKNHVKRILKKTGCHSRSEVMAQTFREGHLE